MTNQQVNPDFLDPEEVADPFAVFYVVNDSRDEEGNIPAEKDILQASSDALVQMLSSDDENVKSLVIEWTNGRIRKLVKRGRGAAWTKASALDLPHFHGKHNSSEVIVFAPMRLSEQPKELKKLQVTGLNSTNTTTADDSGEPHLLVQVNDNLNMSTGKTVAQVGHAVQLFLLYGNEAEKHDWLANGATLRVVKTKNLNNTTVAGIVVRDAGFTEVPSGSLTAVAEYKVLTMEGKKQ